MNPASTFVSRSKLLLIAGLLAVSTILFVLGVAIERGWVGSAATVEGQAGIGEAGETQSQPATAVATPNPEKAGELSETQEQHAAETHQAAGATGLVQGQAEVGHATLLGLNLESPWIITAVVLGSLLLIGALFRFGRRVLVLVLIGTIAALILDMRELFYQLATAQRTIVMLAAAVVITRVITAIVTLLALREQRTVLSSP